MVKQCPQNEVLAIILKRVEDFIGTRNTYIALVNHATESFTPLIGDGIVPDMLRTYAPVKKGHGLAGRAWQDGRSIFVNEKDRAQYDSPLFSNGFSAAIAIPIFKNEEVVGVLGAAFVESVRDFDALDARHLEAFGEIICAALHNANLQERLEKSEQLVAQLLDRMGEGMASTDSTSAITLINRRLCEMIGLRDASEAIGWKATDIFPDYYEALAVGYGNFISGKNNEVARTTLRHHPDGALAPVLLSGTPRIEGYELAGSYLVARDIRELDEVERELKAARREMEHAEVFRQQFLAIASHELRTPLNAILGLTQILLGMSLGEEAAPLLETVHESAENMSRLVSDILDYSRLEAGKLTLSAAPFNLRDFAGHVERSFGVEAKERKTTLKIALDEDAPVLLIGDENRLRQVMINLITNAFKFTANGKINARISLEKPAPGQPADAATLKFVVQDTGVGIPQPSRQHIFEPFYTEPGKTGAGTGLGLSITRHIVELMGGKIWLDETTERGARFIFTVQFKTAA